MVPVPINFMKYPPSNTDLHTNKHTHTYYTTFIIRILKEFTSIFRLNNPFQANFPFLYPLKASENIWFSKVFRGYRKTILAWNECIFLSICLPVGKCMFEVNYKSTGTSREIYSKQTLKARSSSQVRCSFFFFVDFEYVFFSWCWCQLFISSRLKACVYYLKKITVNAFYFTPNAFIGIKMSKFLWFLSFLFNVF